MFQKLKLHNRANIYLGGHGFKYSQAKARYLFGWSSGDRRDIVNTAWIACLAPMFRKRETVQDGHAGILLKQGLFHFRPGASLTAGGLYFVRRLGNKPGRWLAKSGGSEDVSFNPHS